MRTRIKVAFVRGVEGARWCVRLWSLTARALWRPEWKPERNARSLRSISPGLFGSSFDATRTRKRLLIVALGHTQQTLSNRKSSRAADGTTWVDQGRDAVAHRSDQKRLPIALASPYVRRSPSSH
jgi:hypothetical protein